MSQSADIQLISLEEILQILRNQALAMPTSSTSSRYLQALNSLQASLQASAHGEQAFLPAPKLKQVLPAPSSDREAGLSQGDLRYALRTTHHAMRTLLANWLVSQWLTATPFSTASLYLDIISSLYGSAVKQSLLPKTNLFSQLKAELKALGPQGWKSGIDDEIFDRALRLTKNASNLLADDHTAAQLVIYSLTHSLQPLSDIAMLKRSDVKESRVKSQEPRSQDSQGKDNLSFIIDNSSLSVQRKKYLFPLRNRSARHIAKIVNALFRRARLPQSTDPYQTVEALWAYAALRTGIPATTLVSTLGHAPLGLPILKLCVDSFAYCENQTDLQSADGESHHAPRSTHHDEYFSQVGKIFLENPPQWYAMSLRPGVRFTQICRRIQLLGDRLPDIQLFYPSEEITRAIGKKIVVRQRPFIHSVVFFRAKLTDIGRLFARIGDLAWCYRQTARPGAPYAHISDAQFRQFQQTIAQFTPDYEVAPAGELQLHEGDRVQILGGLFTGLHATIIEKGQESRVNTASPARRYCGSAADTAQSSDTSAQQPESNVVYRLNIIGDNGIEWRISVDPRLLKAP